MTKFQMRPLDVVIMPDPTNPHEAEGLLNPAAARGEDGNLYLSQGTIVGTYPFGTSTPLRVKQTGCGRNVANVVGIARDTLAASKGEL